MLQLRLQRRVIAGSVKVSGLGAFLFLLVQRWTGAPPRRPRWCSRAHVGTHPDVQHKLVDAGTRWRRGYAGDGLVGCHDTGNSDSLCSNR
jgi:hypothetical protein